jgi:photosystem II stability/assembly factor-like uncharacterized protein
MTDQNLVSFIKESLKQGGTRSDIEKSLLDKGWQVHSIQEGFQEIKDHDNSENSYIKKAHLGIFSAVTFLILTYTLFGIFNENYFGGIRLNTKFFLGGELTLLLVMIAGWFLIKKRSLNIQKIFSNKFLIIISLVCISIPYITILKPRDVSDTKADFFVHVIFNLQHLGFIILLLISIHYLIFVPFKPFLGNKLKRFGEICLAQIAIIIISFYFLSNLVKIDGGFWVAEEWTGASLLSLYYPLTYFLSLVIVVFSKQIAYKNILFLKVYRLFFVTLSIILLLACLVGFSFGSIAINPEDDFRVMVPGSFLTSNSICSCFGKRVDDPFVIPQSNVEGTGFCYGIARCEQKPQIINPGIDLSQNPQISSVNNPSEISEIINNFRWQPITISGNPIFYRVYFINKNIGFLLSIQGSIYKTTDGGKNWSKKLDNPVYSLSDITFIDEQIGYIVGVEHSGGSNKMLLLYTNDSGETWEATSKVLDNFLPLALSFPTKNIGYFTGVSGKIAKFDAQTLSWTLLHDNPDQSSSYIKFFDEKKGHIVVDNSQEDKSQLLSTDDGGATWKIKDVSQPIINSVYFSSYQNGIAIGGNHGILKSSNGGENWSQSASRINNAVESIYFKDDQLSGSVVTTIGEVFETKDGGNSWTIYKPIDSVFDNSGRRFLSDIYYQDFENAYAIDNNGQVYKLIKE